MKRNLLRYIFIGISVLLSLPLLLFLVYIALSFARFNPAARVIGISATLLLAVVHLFFVVFTAYYYSTRLGVAELARKFLVMLACLAFLTALSDLIRLYSLMWEMQSLHVSLGDLWRLQDTLLAGGGALLGFLLGGGAYFQRKKLAHP